MNSQELLQIAKTLLQKITAQFAQKCADAGDISSSKIDQQQQVAYDIAWLSSQLYAAQESLEFAQKVQNPLEQACAEFFLAESVNDLSSKVSSRIQDFGLSPQDLLNSLWKEETLQTIQNTLSSENISKIFKLIQQNNGQISYGLDESHAMFRETFKKFAEDVVMPLAEKVHRHDDLIPSQIIDGLKEMGCFGLSIPQKFGGFQDDAKADNTGMCVVTEELSRGGLGIAGSLITRPEILSKALLKGGTEEQKSKWLPLFASGERMAAVAVTEPDFGSDVAGMKVSAKAHELNGKKGWLINGVKTWCTFAGYADSLMVLCRTNPDMSLKHKGMSILIAEKPRFEGHEFKYDQPEGGHIEGKAIPTIGYRGMHSFEVAFENYWVPEENLVGGEQGLGKGFYLQMEGFAGGRLQTAARATGVMQAAFEAALKYAHERKVFNQAIAEYSMTQYKLVRMLSIIQASRQATFHACRLMDDHQGVMEASLVKFYCSKISEWVAREALQIHGGYGYAEEYAVSRYYVDSRVFSIFEGAEEVLALKVIAPALLKQALKK